MASPKTPLTTLPLTEKSPPPHKKWEQSASLGHFPTLSFFVLIGGKNFASGGDVHVECISSFYLNSVFKVFQIFVFICFRASLSKSKSALNCLVLERAEKLNNFGSSEATFQTFKGATPELILPKPLSDAIS